MSSPREDFSHNSEPNLYSFSVSSTERNLHGVDPEVGNPQKEDFYHNSLKVLRSSLVRGTCPGLVSGVGCLNVEEIKCYYRDCQITQDQRQQQRDQEY